MTVQAWALALAAATAAPALPGASAMPHADLVAELEQRLERHGADAVNTYLVAQAAGAVQPLHRATAACELPAVSLALRLSRSAQARAVQSHIDALRVATGGCARFVLALARPQEIPRLCASLASWSPAQTARELRRRMALIDGDETLRATRVGRACRAAYRHELENTRVVVRRATP